MQSLFTRDVTDVCCSDLLVAVVMVGGSSIRPSFTLLSLQQPHLSEKWEAYACESFVRLRRLSYTWQLDGFPRPQQIYGPEHGFRFRIITAVKHGCLS